MGMDLTLDHLTYQSRGRKGRWRPKEPDDYQQQRGLLQKWFEQEMLWVQVGLVRVLVQCQCMPVPKLFEFRSAYVGFGFVFPRIRIGVFRCLLNPNKP
jgi:hypothetical protein